MKVCILIPNDELGGAEQYLKNLALHFSHIDYIVDVYFLKRENTHSWDNLKEHKNVNLYFTNQKKELIGCVFMTYNLLRKRKFYDYVFTSHVHLNFLAGFYRKIKIVNGKYFVGRESTIIHNRFIGFKLWLFNFAYKTFYNKLDLLICQSKLMKDNLLLHQPRLSEMLKLEVIPNPINLEFIHEQMKMNGNLNLNIFGNYIVSAGRLINEKGFDILIRAFSKLNRKDLTLLILGKGERHKDLEDLANHLGVRARVVFLGFVENVFPYFKNAKVCVVSSRIEGFPNVLLQMMACNSRVVSTECAGGIKDIDGILVADVEDVVSLSKGLTDALSDDFNDSEKRDLFSSELKRRDFYSFFNNIKSFLVYEK